ncbi:UDP-galactopyranose mutase [Tissierella creatinini]|nr:UDP-galactopyranose mutase [Tissierella creatinini]TJX61554.1 UDP-galactopyranose mutase [Soehngenia saccharolytica]
MQEIVVVGTGFSGSILARKVAEELNIKVLIVEKRSHIGGNMYDEIDKGILVQRYGPHFLNTNKYWIIDYLSKYAELFEHNNKLLSYIDGKYVRLPFNFQTVQQLITPAKSELLLSKMRKEFYGRDRVPILELVEHQDADIRNYGELLFEKAYRTYISKQWGIPVEKIDRYVLDRVPMAMNYDERYLNKDFQYLPKEGYTKLFENMLNHPNIEVVLNTDAIEHIQFDGSNNIIKYDGHEIKLLIFTGAIDELFSLKFGDLPYRSLDIRYEYYEEDSVLPSEVVSYPQAEGYTRKTEYKKFNYKRDVTHSVVAAEYPLQYNRNASIGNIPFYPVTTDESTGIYKNYLLEVEKYGNIILCGRLAEFKYYNMDICIEHAFEKFEEVKNLLCV